MSNTIRIATVTATGARYVVQQISIPKRGEVGRVHCWGEVTSFSARTGTKHAGSKAFLASAVTVVEVPFSAKLMEELFDQYITSLRAKGNVVTASRNGRTFTNHGTPEQMAATQEARARFAAVRAQLRRDPIASLSALLYGTDRDIPAGVRDGGAKELPESREDIRNSILDKLADAPAGTDAIRQDYSNGEFISSSLIVGTTLESVQNRKLDLDGADHTAYYDAELGVYWRRGGSWD